MARVARHGPLRFDEVMEAALYDPEWGFYASGGRAGRRGDFITSAEVGPLFGAVVARALDSWWIAAGSPRPFVVVEAGAGVGTLARSVLAATPACSAALRYVLVERAAVLRAEHERGLPLVLPMHAFAAGREPEEDEEIAPIPDGPLAVSLESLPPSADVVIANELLDNLPIRLLERGSDGWAEVGVGEDLAEVLLPTPIAPLLDAPVGARVAWQQAAAQWLRDALDVSPRVVVFDYMTTTEQMARRPWTEWVRTYRGHERGRSPLGELGFQDITCEVALDQLALVRAPELVRDQRTFLEAHGIEALVEDGRAAWERGAAQGDVDAIKGRSRVREAEALTDISGLGGFTVAEWVR
ncbi:MAG TPA: SAM-dependent methyltransferase [Acidimicrobiales bacterium]|nr:SAM-dependent methyltransferase [Acidimicrobiales bacterium]